jgi:trehalose 6-phosphate phosphatase
MRIKPLVDALTLIASDPKAAGLFLDVDGVLAPIVDRPDEATVPAETRRELVRLAGRYALVACVTGRPGDVARRIVGVDGIRYVGEHGLELDPDAAAWAEQVRAFADGAGWRDVERKPLSVAFHYRTAPDPQAARVALEGVARDALAAGLRTRWGRLVLEVLPPVEATKGSAVRQLLAESGLRRALYAGDDTTDLDGFSALDGLDGAVRIAVVSTEGPSELAARADLVVGSTGAFRELLARL